MATRSSETSTIAVPPLRLTRQDELELRRLVPQLAREIVSHYERFVFCDQRTVDESKWKHRRSGGDLHAYKERHVSQRRVHTNGEPLGPQQQLAQHSSLPRVLLTGTIPGSLDDVMYALSYQDTPSFDNFWVGFGDRKMVARVEGATIDDPYRLLGVVWFARSFPFNLIQPRDFLAVVVSRITRLSNGDRIGIVCGHSIEHRDLPERSGARMVRGISSTLQLYRQLDEGRVEVFLLQFIDNKGSVPQSHHVQASISYLMPLVASLSNIGFRKKLAWLVQHRKRDDLEATDSESTCAEAIEPQSSGRDANCCDVCDQELGSLFASPSKTCAHCSRRICSRCSVSHELVVRARTGRDKLTLQAYAFCRHCSQHAQSTSTFMVAQHDALHRHLGRTTRSSFVTSRDHQPTTLFSTHEQRHSV